MRNVLSGILIIFSVTMLSGQQNILNQTDILERVENCLFSTYGYNFSEAYAIQSELERELPDHPAPYFLKALIIYWENFPLLPKDPKVEKFVSAMNKAIDLSQDMKKVWDTEMEGVFFDMHARAFKGMFWADNGKIARVIPDLDNMYINTMKGIEFKEDFNEFYFSSALYNYYLVAYVDKHPAYKPIVALFRKGDRALGLKELQYAIDSTTYIKYEALLFMSLIQLNYEENLYAAADYMDALYRYFPENIYYLGQYLIILLHNQKYTAAAELNDELASHPDEFNQMIYCLSEGFLQENHKKNNREAKKYYQKTINYSKQFGTIAELYAAIAHAGLSRIAEEEGHQKSARKHRRLSSQLSAYDFILDF